jgi:hypothetical protein
MEKGSNIIPGKSNGIQRDRKARQSEFRAAVWLIGKL